MTAERSDHNQYIALSVQTMVYMRPNAHSAPDIAQVIEKTGAYTSNQVLHVIAKMEQRGSIINRDGKYSTPSFVNA
jgi:hypothetical protein